MKSNILCSFTTSGLSNALAVEFMKTVVNVCDTECRTKVHLPAYKTIRDKFVGVDVFSLKKISHRFLPSIFGKEDMNSKTLKAVTGVRLNLMERLCYALKQINPDKFAFKPDARKCQKSSERIYTQDFASGTLMENLYEVLKVSHGQDAVPLCLAFFWDGTNVSTRRNECPLSFMILNCAKDEVKWHFLGYVPENYPYTPLELSDLLVSKFNASRNLADRLVKAEFTRIRREFIYKILEPLLAFDESGLILQVGDQDENIRHCFIFYCADIGDTVELDKFVGTAFLGSTCACRICTKHHTSSFSEPLLKLALGATVKLDRQFFIDLENDISKQNIHDKTFIISNHVYRKDESTYLWALGKKISQNEETFKIEYGAENFDVHTQDFSLHEFQNGVNNLANRFLQNPEIDFGKGGVVIGDILHGLYVHNVDDDRERSVYISLADVKLATSRASKTPIPGFDLYEDARAIEANVDVVWLFLSEINVKHKKKAASFRNLFYISQIVLVDGIKKIVDSIESLITISYSLHDRKIGSHVHVQTHPQNVDREWLEGKITSINDDGTYDIQICQ